MSCWFLYAQQGTQAAHRIQKVKDKSEQLHIPMLCTCRRSVNKAHLLLAAGETSTEGMSSYTAPLASHKARALLAMQTSIPGFLTNIIHQTTEVLQRQ